MVDNNTLTMTFSLACNPQMQSDLMMLPAELRLKVLRYLLRDTEIFRAMSTDSVDKWIESPIPTTVQLSTQSLRACQRLYKEGIDILRWENVVELNFSMRASPGREPRRRFDDHRLRFAMFSGGFLARQSGYSASLDASYAAVLQDWTWRRETNARSDYFVSDELRSLAIACLESQMSCMKSIQRLQIKVCYFTQVDVFIACQLLRHFCVGKSVVLELSKASGDEHTMSELEAIRSCRGLRCHEIKFQGVSDTTENNLVMNETTSKIVSNDQHPQCLQTQRRSIERKIYKTYMFLWNVQQNRAQIWHNKKLKLLVSTIDKAIIESEDAMFHTQRRNVLDFLQGLMSEAIRSAERTMVQILDESDAEDSLM